MFSFAKYWAEQGHSITVLTTQKYTFDGELTYHPRINSNLSIVEVPYASLFTKFSSSKKKCPVSTYKNGKKKQFFITQVKNIIKYFRSAFGGTKLQFRDLWVKNAVRVGKELCDKTKYDFMLSSYYPAGAHIVASKLKASFPHLFWVADYRDLWCGNHAIRNNRVINFFERRHEQSVLNSSNLIATVSEPLAACLRQTLKKEVCVIENGYDASEIESLNNEKIFPESNVFRVVYTGTIYPGFQDPTPFFQAVLKLLKHGVITENSFKVIFFGNARGIKRLISKYNLENIVELPGFISKDDALRAQRDADALLFLDWEVDKNSLVSQGVYSGKIFEYLISGTEIVSIGSDHKTITGKLIREVKAGNCYGKNVPKIYQKLQEMVSQRTSLSIEHSVIEQFRRDRKAIELLKMIEQKLKKDMAFKVA